MNKFIVFVIIVGVFITYKRNVGRTSPASTSIKASGYTPSGGVVVIEYTDPDDLLAKLRKVKVGQKLDLREVGSKAPVSTGLYCNDKVGIANFMAQEDARLARLNRELEIEFARINKVP
jgi:hypothetical protein